ncbi:hypothetical protein [Alkalihalobacillus sp. TS-13]|uniref:hypothetical protein n=1 Tax=Alkalihalobacillus sp. TS-13 TaxID=2842455 RepID=UPI001C88C353|nr:hypothetical protein [Alkalihalobacillus sp. TS-13]
MSNHFTIKLVTDPNYHLWCDTLHARELARTTNDNWAQGTYVRWTILSSWTVLEQCCKEALSCKRFTNFQSGMNKALASNGLPPLTWKSGTWMRVKHLKRLRNYYTHENANQKELWPGITKAEEAIDIVREAVKDIYSITGKKYPQWIDDDTERSFS